MIAQTENNNVNIEEVPFMSTLTTCVNKVIKDGYTDNLKMTKQGLFCDRTDKTYAPTDIMIKDFYRFEGQSDPGDNAIMYVIETEDGVKGTLIDAYGTYADENINKFMGEVKEINKKKSMK